MPRVLLIEDSTTQAAQYKMQLESSGFEVDIAPTLASGVARLKQEGIDAVLLDLNLPDSEGLDTFQTAFAAAGQTPIVILTHRDDEELAATTVQRGAQDYLVKGEVNQNWLRRSIQHAMNRVRAESTKQANNRASKPRRHTSVDIESTDDVVVARINEKQLLDARVNAELSEQLVRHIAAGCSKMVINFGNVEYVSNAAMGVLLVLRRRMQTHGGKLCLCELREGVFEQLSARQFHRLFEIFDNSESAVAKLKSQP